MLIYPIGNCKMIYWFHFIMELLMCLERKRKSRFYQMNKISFVFSFLLVRIQEDQLVFLLKTNSICDNGCIERNKCLSKMVRCIILIDRNESSWWNNIWFSINFRSFIEIENLSKCVWIINNNKSMFSTNKTISS